MSDSPTTIRTIGNSNKFKLGLFSYNNYGGLTNTLAPERWDASWENTVTLTRAAEDAGLEFMLPLAGWLGHAGAESSTDGHFHETMAWAAGLLQATSRIHMFATLHVPFINPVFAAKQAVTCDHIGHGRFGINVVAGYNRDEFDMLGVEYLGHDERYAYLDEWTTLVKRMWTEEEPFDFSGRYFNLKGVWTKPRPAVPGRPTVVSAGSSPAGRAFALRQADALFMIITDLETLAAELRQLHTSMEDRQIEVFSSGHVICRETRREAEEYLHYLLYENGDWAAGHYMQKSYEEIKSVPDEVVRSKEFLERLMSGHGTYRVLGSPDDVVATFQRMSDAGLDGMAFALPSYLADFEIIRDEVLPRMESAGLREPFVLP
ncbi:MAG TPA: LLM class flavin-dependent oxidoreductase [Pseudonocardia sp.]|jgi:alkanesulfonate monooxygenase SsuD/methylene tetrahydromethanopterin reductase-like flavin-dependent oxidoreductase (luciferase family)|nr:LLM class flavin-dependent oxidoreductase [Pseudonocardia sp.]